jgi:lycopene cyclase domain-containing protein
VIVGTGIVGYDPARILGLRIGVAPIEDFAYPVAAALALPALWTLLGPRREPPC